MVEEGARSLALAPGRRRALPLTRAARRNPRLLSSESVFEVE
jgi:hypothetical protein